MRKLDDLVAWFQNKVNKLRAWTWERSGRMQEMNPNYRPFPGGEA